MKIKLPSTEFILYALGAAQTLGMGYAAYVYEAANDPLLKTIALIRGLIGGFAVSFTLAIGAQRVPRIQAKRAQQLGYIIGIILLFAVPLYMAPSIYKTMSPYDVQWIRVIVSVFGSALFDLAAVVLAVQSGALQAGEAPLIVAEPKPKKKKAAEPAVISEAVAVVVPQGHWEAPHPCPHCIAAGAIITPGVNSFSNKAQYSGHVGKCKNRPVRVDVSA